MNGDVFGKGHNTILFIRVIKLSYGFIKINFAAYNNNNNNNKHFI